MARRSKAREVAVQMLYQLDLNPEVSLPAVREMVYELLRDEDLREMAWRLIVGVREMRPQLDEHIQKVAANWSLKRMAPTDRNVLRLGLFELLAKEVPPPVVLDESIELARRFGSAHSAQFVNGILDRLVPEDQRDKLVGRPKAAPPVLPVVESPPPDLRNATRESLSDEDSEH